MILEVPCGGLHVTKWTPIGGGGSFQQIIYVYSPLLVCHLVSVLEEVPPKVHVLVPSSPGRPTGQGLITKDFDVHWSDEGPLQSKSAIHDNIIFNI